MGFTLCAPGQETYRAVRTALDAGYRLVDTASFYRNEEDVGRAVRDSGVRREEVFITTKLWNEDHGYDSALRAFDASLDGWSRQHRSLPDPLSVTNVREDSWRALENIMESGKARAIGVSNYTVHHLKELLGQAAMCRP